MKLGYASPAKMLREMRPSELGLWAAMYAIDPWDEQRADLRAGVVASVVANVHRDSRQRPKPYVPKDFMPFAHDPEQEQKTVAAQLRAFLRSAGEKKKANR